MTRGYEEALARVVEGEPLEPVELDALAAQLAASPAEAAALREELELADLLAQQLHPARRGFVERVAPVARLTVVQGTHSILSASPRPSTPAATSFSGETVVSQLSLSDLLWKYFQYAKFAFMLVALWTFLSFYRSCGMDFAPRQNHQMAPFIAAGKMVVFSDPTQKHISKLQRGDAVIYGDPEAKGEKGVRILAMGRVIALPGERISAREGEVFINGKKHSEAEYLKNNNREQFTIAEQVVPEGHVYLLVDNRAGFEKFRFAKQMADSRHLGPIPAWAIKAKITKPFKYAN